MRHGRFGDVLLNESDYTLNWFMRSLIPFLYDNSLDSQGFPLMHGDFHSSNIFVVDTNPRVTTIINWDNTTAVSASSFAQYPLFIVDHPMWEEDHPFRSRNVRDQVSFEGLIQKAEQGKFLDTTPCLSRAFFKWYLFEQCAFYENMYYYLLWDFVTYPAGTIDVIGYQRLIAI